MSFNIPVLMRLNLGRPLTSTTARANASSKGANADANRVMPAKLGYVFLKAVFQAVPSASAVSSAV